MDLWGKFCGFMLRVSGWKIGEPAVPEEKCVILGVPHTSMLDFAVSYLYYRSLGYKARCMIKKEMFFPPLGWLLKALGGVPVDRKNATAMLMSVLEKMDEPGIFHLALSPEGTRKPVRNWKTGYHFIATKAGVPVYLGYFDWGRKVVGRGQKVELTGDARADTKRIQQIYEDMHLVAKHPERYVTH